MTQVTMTGIEFRNMIKMEDEREELLNIFVKAQKVKFTKKNISQYGAGQFASMEYPTWVEETLNKCMEAQLLLKEDDELALWFKSECFYFRPLTREFSRYEWDGGIHMLDYSDKLRARYEAWQATQGKEAEDNE